MKLKLYKYLLAVTAVCLAHFSYGQSRTVTGAVSTLDGNIPLEGVSVLVTGTDVATVNHLRWKVFYECTSWEK